MAHHLLQRICLRPNWSLRRQLFYSFGMGSFLTLSLTVLCVCLAAHAAGRTVRNRAAAVLQEQVIRNLLAKTGAMADQLTQYMATIDGTVQLAVEMTRDRIVGYPHVSGNAAWVRDAHVPFYDMDSQTRKYPLQSQDFIRFDWDIVQNVHKENVGEHLQERAATWQSTDAISTATASFFFQGTCDPSVTDPKDDRYFPHCTTTNNNNNNFTTNTTLFLMEKAADLGVLLKPLYESQSTILRAGIYFVNGGVGAKLLYPGLMQPGASEPYISEGCSWILEHQQETHHPTQTETETQPNDKLVGVTQDDIDKYCRPAGTRVPLRLYNPLERAWFRSLVHHSFSPDTAQEISDDQRQPIRWYGPFSSNDHGIPIITVGRAVTDRLTGNLIGCVAVDLAVSDIQRLLMETQNNDPNSYMALLRYQDGSVVADTLTNSTNASTNTSSSSTDDMNHTDFDNGYLHGIIAEASHYEAIFRLLDFNQTNWTRASLEQALADHIINCPVTGDVLTAFPIPVPPDKYDPNYRPSFLLFQRISNRAFDPVEEMTESINRDVQTILISSVGLGILGILLLFAIVWCESRVLTEPLLWMEGVAWQIVNHTDKRAVEDLRMVAETDEETKAAEAATTTKSRKSKLHPFPCALPRTEITELVSEFRKMIHGFSGSGAAHVSEPEVQEIRNELTWQSDFRQLYSNASRNGDGNDHSSTNKKDKNGFEKRVSVTGRRRRSSNFRMDAASHGTEDESSADCCSGGDDEGDNNNNNNIPRETPSMSQAADIAAASMSEDDDKDDDHDEGNEMQPAAVSPPIVPQQHHPIMQQDEPFLMIVPAPLKQNRGPNIIQSYSGRMVPNRLQEGLHGISPRTSKLFWWILTMIVIPLLLLTVLICYVQSQHVTCEVPQWVRVAKDASVDQERQALQSITASKAKLAMRLLSEPIRDLHLLTRTAGWLLFGGINRSDSFTYEDEITEECKAYAEAYTCPVYATNRTPCPCQWKDPQATNCSDVTDLEYVRDIQRLFFLVQSRDADPITGNRNSTSYPAFDTTANTTSWWDNVNVLPGASIGANASRYTTTYDRVRVSSPMAVVEFPVYNYATSMHRTKLMLGTYLSFEADGLFTGFSGCDYSEGMVSQFQSNDGNRAAEVAPHLCPLGKFGFDPRCRPWYSTGRQNYLQNQTAVYVTPPYAFAAEDNIATSASSPIANPTTGEYVGQVLYDFFPSGIRNALTRLEAPISFLITPEEDFFGGDTVIGPDKNASWQSSPISDLLFPYEPVDSINRLNFQRDILPRMKSGDTDIARFQRIGANGELEIYTLAFYPVFERVLLPLDPSNFSRGVSVSDMLVYSVGIALLDSGLRAPFDTIEQEVRGDLNRLRYIFSAMIALVSCLFTIFTCLITVNVTKPMITLLRVVQHINAGNSGGDIPPLKGGSTEVRQVYNSFAKLYKIVRISNKAFFSGNLQWAYHFMNDALKLFRKVDDQKAIGIANNNLGNTYFVWIDERQQKFDLDPIDEDVCGTQAALMHYDEAINVANRECEQATSDESKADFMQQLADRHFNRGLFFLLIQNEPDAPDDARERGFNDLVKARELDNDIRDFWLDRRLLLKNSLQVFSRLIRRIYGLVKFYDEPEIEKVWDAKELVDDADRLLFAAWNELSAPLFKNFSRVGRLQQLEAAVIQLELRLGNNFEAARLAMRSFAEDEFILESTFSSAATALLSLARDNEKEWFSRKTISSLRSDLRKMAKSTKSISLDIGKCVVVAFELGNRWEGDAILDKLNAKYLELYEDWIATHEHMGIVAYTSRGDLTVELGIRAENEGRQRATLDIATSSTSMNAYPAFPFAVQMIVDSCESVENESYIILLTDGFSWDSQSYPSIKWQIDRLNRERNTGIHVIILGLNVARPAIIEQFKEICTISKSSFYSDITIENMDTTFDAISACISGRRSVRSLNGITMEKF